MTGRDPPSTPTSWPRRSEEHTSELQSQSNLVCRLLLEKKKQDSKHGIRNKTLPYAFGCWALGHCYAKPRSLFRCGGSVVCQLVALVLGGRSDFPSLVFL